MPSLFKRKTAATFKSRVEEFWRWYAERAPGFYETIDAGSSASLAEEVGTKVDELQSGFAWEFGPGANGEGHSFTLSGESNLHRQFLADYWLSRAPVLKGWTFYDARQPSPQLDAWAIEIGGQRFEAIEFWFATYVDKDSEHIDITAWHPAFARLQERERFFVLFLMLDATLGEFGTQTWIGDIKIGDQRLADAIPLKELPSLISSTQAAHGWQKYPPTDVFTVYSIEEPHDRFQRGDIITGVSCNMILQNEFFESEDELEDPLAGTGADYVFVQFDNTILPEGEQAEARGKIEDALDDALTAAHSGRVLGGAMGTENAYVDLLLFDGAASLEIVRKVLHDANLPPDTTIEFFAKEKKKQRFSI